VWELELAAARVLQLGHETIQEQEKQQQVMVKELLHLILQ
jgi:hypothetical protein